MDIVQVPRKAVQTILNATFSDYRRQKVQIVPTLQVRFCDLNWSGGTRSEYRAATLDGQPGGSMDRYHALAPWDPRQVEGQSVPLPSGCCVVRAGFFCGKPSMATIYVHPDDMPKLLPKETV